MAKAPGESRIPTGMKAPLPGAVRRTLSGLSASSRLLPSRLKLPSLKAKPALQDSIKFKQQTLAKKQKNVKTVIDVEDNKNSARNTEKMPPIKSSNNDLEKKDLTFSTCNKLTCNEAEKTFDILNSKDLTFEIQNAEKTFSIDKERGNEKDLKVLQSEERKMKDKNNEGSKFAEHIGSRVSAVLSDGKSVGVSTVTGILRYAGHVQIDGDIWCGIETDAPSKTYHNGSFNGVKYFSCKNNHGLLVPCSQIKLQSAPTYVVDPKILELRNKLQNVRSKTSTTTNNILRPNVIDITQQLVDERTVDNHGESGPFSLLVGLNTPTPHQGKTNSELNHTKVLDDKDKSLRISLPTSSSTPKFLNPLINIKATDEKAPRLSDVNVRMIEAESIIELQSITFDMKNDGRNSVISNLLDPNMPMIGAESIIEFQSLNFDSMSKEPGRQSLILSKPNNCDISTSKFETPPSTLPNSGNIAFSTPHVAESSEQKSNNEHAVASCNTNEEGGKKHFILGPLTRKQNCSDTTPDSRTEEEKRSNSSIGSKVTENRIKPAAPVTQELPSPTVSENSANQISKQNSFDESLGILTPDHMDSISFLDNVRSPSADDLNDFLDSSKTTEKTVSSNSQTPSTENVKSLTPDVLKSLLNMNDGNGEMANNIENEKEELCENIENENAENLETTIVNERVEKNILLVDFEESDVKECHDDEYNAFAQAPFKQSTAENLSTSELCSTTVTQNIEDELLPSVHSSILDPLSSVVDTTVNLDLPLDSRRFDSTHPPVRMDQTPSPEELPLDPVDVRTDLSTISVNQFCNSIIQEQSQADSDTKTDTTKSVTSKVSNSFITSITSITSLDGYQGDGEMSRPVSRGADQSPTIGHRGVNNLQNHWQNIPINRRPDPMTDSDFFTESDADGHDEQVHRGDRRAQVIDGALYGSGKASNPPVMVSRNGNSNNDDSCMESSGVFTDMETHRCSPLLLNVIDDLSPEGSTPSTRSELSQKNNSGIFYEAFNGSFNETIVAVMHSPNQSGDMNGSKDSLPNLSKQVKNSPSSGSMQKNEENSSNDKMNKDERNMALKKYKMPRRDVASKVKTMLATKPNDDENPEKRPSPKNTKKGGRWDAVMNKISANKSEAKPKSYLKDVKSKVTSRTEMTRKSLEEASIASGNTSPKVRTPPSKLKSRRVRNRISEVTSLPGASGRSSPHSSQSDVSCGAPHPKHAPPKHTNNRTSKKRDGRPTSPPVAPTPPATVAPTPAAPPLTRTQTAPVPKQTNGPIVKKGSSPVVGAVVAGGAARGVGAAARKPAPRRAATTLSPRHPAAALKDHPRPASPRASPPTAGAPPAPLPAPPPPQPPPPTTKGVEALAVLVHYLVFQLDALNAPRWRVQAANARAQLAEAATRLQRALNAQTADHHAVTECLSKISDLEAELSSKEAQYAASVRAITSEAEAKYKAALEDSAALSNEIRNLKSTLGELRKEVADSRAAVARCEREGRAREQQRTALEQELQRLRQENLQLKQSQPGSKEAILSAEVESLKSVLELKLSELGEERRRGEKLRQAAGALPAAMQRAQAAQSLADYLRTQLQRKLSDEANLIQQNKQLHENCVQMTAQKNRLSLHNEQLQYKLKHNTEVANLLAQSSLNAPGDVEQERLNSTFPETFVRGTNSSRTTASFNEKYLRSSSYDERHGDWMSPRRSARSDSSGDKSDFSERSRPIDCFLDENSPPNSPKIKGVVEKNDSVSWIVEIEEPPEETVSRIVKRASSFRISTSPQSTRENLKRQRPRPKGSPLSPSHPLTQSASASSLESSMQGGAHCKLFRSNSIENKQYSGPVHASTPYKGNRRPTERPRLSESLPISRPRASSLSHENRVSTKSISSERRGRSSSLNKEKKIDLEKAMLLVDGFDGETLVSNGDLALLQECEAVPKESAGEALISGANSEDDSSLDDRSHSPSDSESVSESDKYLEMNGAGERLADPVLQKIAETMGQSLSTTPMEVSWSEDGECLISETDI